MCLNLYSSYLATSYYTDSNASNVYELGNFLDKIPKRGSNMPNIFLTGDYNVPDIDWQIPQPKPNPQYGLDTIDYLATSAN